MADTIVPTALRVKQWDDNFFEEYIRGNRLAKYMGTDENAVVQVRETLMKKAGDTIYFELINKLAGAGKQDNATLEGFEEDLSQRSWALTVHLYRHGVVVPEYEEQVTAISLRDAAKSALKNWSIEHTRDKLLRALGAKNALTPTFTAAYATANATALNAWLAANSDRVLFGKLASNYSAGVFGTALATIDNTDDKLTAAAVSLAKRIAKTSTPKIHPIRVNGDEEWYVMFANSLAFRDLRNDTSIINAWQYAADRGDGNPLFTDGDIIWDGVIIREIPELSYNTWASTIAVGESYLCGAQALGLALAQRWNTRTQDKDYQTKHGVAIQQIYDVGKIQFGAGATDTDTLKDNGVLTLFNAAVADA